MGFVDVEHSGRIAAAAIDIAAGGVGTTDVVTAGAAVGTYAVRGVPLGRITGVTEFTTGRSTGSGAHRTLWLSRGTANNVGDTPDGRTIVHARIRAIVRRPRISTTHGKTRPDARACAFRPGESLRKKKSPERGQVSKEPASETTSKPRPVAAIFWR
jgi:hypothetical protein